MKIYKHLSQEQRYQIEALLNAGKSQSFISRQLGCHRSTISRELKRNTAQAGPDQNRYTANFAAYRCSRRQAERYPGRKFNAFMRDKIVKWLTLYKFSPELIAQWGQRLYRDFVSHQFIYEWIARMRRSTKQQDRAFTDLYRHLKHGGRRRKRRNHGDNKGLIPNRTPIELRCSAANNRRRVGDAEVDLVLGKNHRPGILIITDRASLHTKLIKINSKRSDHIANRIIKKLSIKNHWIKTLTYDNDLAFAKHEKVNKALGTKSYFTRPYCSQDKGTVENRIWQLRRFFPKDTDFDQVTHNQIRRVETLLNNRPVRKFEYRTPNTVFSQMSPVALDT